MKTMPSTQFFAIVVLFWLWLNVGHILVSWALVILQMMRVMRKRSGNAMPHRRNIHLLNLLLFCGTQAMMIISSLATAALISPGSFVMGNCTTTTNTSPSDVATAWTGSRKSE